MAEIQFTDRELDIMGVLWEHGPATAAEVLTKSRRLIWPSPCMGISWQSQTVAAPAAQPNSIRHRAANEGHCHEVRGHSMSRAMRKPTNVQSASHHLLLGSCGSLAFQLADGGSRAAQPMASASSR